MTDFDPTKPVMLRNGRPARIVCRNLKSRTRESIVALVDFGDHEEPRVFFEDGKLVDGEVCEYDLVNAPPIKVEAGGIYETASGNIAFVAFKCSDGVSVGMVSEFPGKYSWREDGYCEEDESHALLKEITIHR